MLGPSPCRFLKSGRVSWLALPRGVLVESMEVLLALLHFGGYDDHLIALGVAQTGMIHNLLEHNGVWSFRLAASMVSSVRLKAFKELVFAVIFLVALPSRICKEQKEIEIGICLTTPALLARKWTG